MAIMKLQDILNHDSFVVNGYIFEPLYYLRNGYKETNKCEIHLIKTCERTGYLANDDKTKIWIYHRGYDNFIKRENSPNVARECFDIVWDRFLENTKHFPDCHMLNKENNGKGECQNGSQIHDSNYETDPEDSNNKLEKDHYHVYDCYDCYDCHDDGMCYKRDPKGRGYVKIWLEHSVFESYIHEGIGVIFATES